MASITKRHPVFQITREEYNKRRHRAIPLYIEATPTNKKKLSQGGIWYTTKLGMLFILPEDRGNISILGRKIHVYPKLDDNATRTVTINLENRNEATKEAMMRIFDTTDIIPIDREIPPIEEEYEEKEWRVRGKNKDFKRAAIMFQETSADLAGIFKALKDGKEEIA